ncbi:GL19610 [Drosophila persimilis]|uniref:Succinate dehydrogenase assembly factor 4, mitochondrial n=2 Tax=pseudoobscura subgroup TaxID=32358 RepID=A0A6I8UKL1_DROPS|nr:succinate dehydrogenase assembly factor 4, mitochondrial [Drosophila pseudoobscura]XP_002015267.1 succinate dehydrogenase assembly factor 4, mitochondrial [Drosophila persimilis]EDW29263.1 GL19610 [Drosophila persimilis]
MQSMAKQSMRALPQVGKQVSYLSTSSAWRATVGGNDLVVDVSEPKTRTEKLMAFQKKLRAKTPLGKLDEFSRHPYQEKEPLKQWPNQTNPYTGEVGGPAGPEPTRYGDWERKGRVSDF